MTCRCGAWPAKYELNVGIKDNMGSGAIVWILLGLTCQLEDMVGKMITCTRSEFVTVAQRAVGFGGDHYKVELIRRFENARKAS